ncbi:mediator of RNA polymerase II transcription subunit 13 isoform X4 [Nasonia vitripennis]|uniref:Mediator of RNA polymerase II transcription subunit 13 n=1 Tax=Nasonia vitripennis TaxID=7425 RepID=A0A7M7QJ82_NASVI|nr:mediator of RNA polymerase II transcription subunit 13 isoform X4 [Nasonia vitripennis]
MTHPSHQTNGASLEDCHTNFFALTDLCGIKWRKLVWGEVAGGFGGNLLEDPVLSSFSRCLQGDILCVWRRVSASQAQNAQMGNPFDINSIAPSPAPPPLSLQAAKELWIFWYGEEPDLTGLVSPELIACESEQGSWESGLSYECRSLLFKALHNLIERCLLSRDFVRLGKWFVQPYDGFEKHRCSSSHLSFSFAFFVHGESTVCASVDVRQHPAVRHLTRACLQRTQTSQSPVKVILAPYGLAGTLTGQVGRLDSQLLDEWKSFYPINSSGLEPGLPALVEVLVGGVRMRYPSCYVLVTDMDESPVMMSMTSGGSGCGAPAGLGPSSVTVNGVGIEITMPLSPPNSPASYEHPLSMQRDLGPATELPERVWAECIVGARASSPSRQAGKQLNNGEANEPNGGWNFVDPTLKSSCSCSKCTSSPLAGWKGGGSLGSSSNFNSSSSNPSGGGKSERTSSGRRIPVPFHRRSTLHWDSPSAAAAAPSSSSTSASSSSVCPSSVAPANTPRVSVSRPDAPKTPPDGGPPSYPRGGPPTGGDCLPVPSVGSPGSPAPSPLPTPHSEPPASIPPADAQNPAQQSIAGPAGAPGSPQVQQQQQQSMSQPAINLLQPPLTPSQGGPKSIPSSNTQVPSPAIPSSVTSTSTPINPQQQQQQHQQQQQQQQQHPQQLVVQAPPPPTLKRPLLTSKEYEGALLDDEQPLPWLYDYSTQEAWLNHPVKRLKGTPLGPASLRHNQSLYPPMNPSSCTAVGQSNLLGENGPMGQAMQAQGQQPMLEIKQEPGTMSGECIGGRPDPYEFDANGEENGTGVDGLKRQRDEPKPSSLFTSEGLQASYKDLDQIFDNSDPDTSSDETNLNQLQVQTPPGSNKSGGGGGHDGSDVRLDSTTSNSGASGANTSSSSGKHSSSSSSSCNRGVGVLRPEELSKMFPTPPSLEHNPVASPCQLGDPSLEQTDLTSAAASAVAAASGTQIVQQHQQQQRQLQRQLPDIYPNMGSPPEEPIDDWSYVFKPPTMCKLVGSSKYAPLTNLPSQSLPPVTLPAHCVYRTSWQCSNANANQNNQDKSSQPTRPNSVQQQQQQQQQVLQQQQQQHQAQLMPASPAQLGTPYGRQQMQGGVMSVRPPPPPYDQPSPATSTTSSYLNKNLNSIEADTPGPMRAPESNSLVVNILLGDTALNIFRDHNFNSCSLCVCNSQGKGIGNIKGADAGTYLAGSWAASNNVFQDDDQFRCNCGFSAVVNRRLAHKAGLFYEDEMEITGIAEDPAEKKKASLATIACCDSKTVPEGIDIVPSTVLELLREQCLIVQSSASSLHKAARLYAANRTKPSSLSVNALEFSDSNELSLAAIDQSKLDGSPVDRSQRLNGVHRWAFLRAKGPQCNGDIVRIMKTVQPLLQEAIQQKATRMWDAPYTVRILTWRGFHRLAGRDTKDRCEPQPVPALVVGYDRDWLSLSPYALSYWEKLLLEPYAGPRDVAYVVVAPDNDCVVGKVKTFFRELSTTYEICRLGKHTPIAKTVRDGILRVGKSTTQKLANTNNVNNKQQQQQQTDEWFKLLGDNHIGECLRLYAQACNQRLAPYLTQVIQDRSLFDLGDMTGSGGKQNQSSSNVTETMPATPDGTPSKPESVEGENARSEAPSGATPNANSTAGNTTPTSQNTTNNPQTTMTGNSQQQQQQSQAAALGPDEEELELPSVVVYLVEPFSLGGADCPDRRRLAILALLRAFAAAVNNMPEGIRGNISVQLISLESVMELGRVRERRKIQDEMRALALNVFLQGRRLLSHNTAARSLTGFGTAAAADLFLKNKDSHSNILAPAHQERNKAALRLYAPAYVLAPLRCKSEAPDSFGTTGPEECSVLYLSYCLSEDQSWLLAVATDDRGEIFETATINIDIPNRKRRKRASARRAGLQKLMDFILGVMSQGVQPWRLVVGRVGRIGHGELKGWSWLLSKKALLKASKHLKDICGQCNLLYPSAAPCVLSACLVSLEPDSNLRLMADQFTPDERFSQASVNCQLSTPQDVTCTHILVFPTSATTQSSQTAFHEQQINEPELGDDELFSALHEDLPEGMEGMTDFNDIFNVWPEPGGGGGQSPSGSPRRPEGSPLGGDGPGSGVGNHDGPGSPYPCSNTPRAANSEQVEESGNLLQQPLALGYLVSTAPTGRMPSWFWSACPHLEGVCPVFLKNALHLHSPAIQSNDELLNNQSAVISHGLDSTLTTDVLRYVLEGYNALSWLSVDANTKDRLSCLPVHMQALMQLYHATAALV